MPSQQRHVGTIPPPRSKASVRGMFLADARQMIGAPSACGATPLSNA